VAGWPSPRLKKTGVILILPADAGSLPGDIVYNDAELYRPLIQAPLRTGPAALTMENG